MSAVVGIDLSTHALDVVRLDEDGPLAEWQRCELHGRDAWARTLQVRGALAELGDPWFGNVHLVALEAPYGHGSDVLNRVVGAVASALPAALRAPERCWVVSATEARAALKLPVRVKPTAEQVAALLDVSPLAWPCLGDEHARDALVLAIYARNVLDAAIEREAAA